MLRDPPAKSLASCILNNDYFIDGGQQTLMYIITKILLYKITSAFGTWSEAHSSSQKLNIFPHLPLLLEDVIMQV